ncbi:hypothetical protein RJ640_000619 [Escallonia rubra]|uniref:Uncharacterized protein n=1 Tax=Escallonia rubra TaxID=112253 RepID=A0AA88TZQ3_9ASTE|nr:hypothetical protein RJ640_000619 [Escallonia rubra]
MAIAVVLATVGFGGRRAVWESRRTWGEEDEVRNSVESRSVVWEMVVCGVGVGLTTALLRGKASTANLSSIFTIDQSQPIEPREIKSVGYQEGSFVRDLLAEKYDSGVSLNSYTTIDQYNDALMNKSVDVIYDELPYINLFLHKHGSNHVKVGPIYKRIGFGFVSFSPPLFLSLYHYANEA